MKKIVKKVYLIPLILILTFMFLNITSIMKISHGQINNDTLNPYANFIFTEFSEQISNSSDMSTIDIPLASDSWNITNIEFHRY
jgi:hypothetical protein